MWDGVARFGAHENKTFENYRREFWFVFTRTPVTLLPILVGGSAEDVMTHIYEHKHTLRQTDAYIQTRT